MESPAMNDVLYFAGYFGFVIGLCVRMWFVQKRLDVFDVLVSMVFGIAWPAVSFFLLTGFAPFLIDGQFNNESGRIYELEEKLKRLEMAMALNGYVSDSSAKLGS